MRPTVKYQKRDWRCGSRNIAALPNSQKARQTRIDAFSNLELRRLTNNRHDDEGAPGIGSMSLYMP